MHPNLMIDTEHLIKYDLIERIYKQHSEKIKLILEDSIYKNAFSVLSNFVHKTTDLKESINNLNRTEHFYSSQCLSRVLYEQFIVSYYIWTKSRLEKNDLCAVDYLIFYPLFETIKQDNYNLKLLDKYNKELTPLENFLSENENFRLHPNPLSQDDFLQINAKSNQFDIRKIITYLNTNIDKNDPFINVQFLFIELCKAYNKLSSYVHGGRLAEMSTYENCPPIDKELILKGNITWALIINNEIKHFILILVLLSSNEFDEIYSEISEQMNQVLKQV